MLLQGDPGELGQRLARDIVVGRSEAACDDDERGLAGGEAKGLLDIRTFVIDAHRADTVQAQRVQSPGDEMGVSIRIGAREQFAARDDNHVAGRFGGWFGRGSFAAIGQSDGQCDNEPVEGACTWMHHFDTRFPTEVKLSAAGETGLPA